MSSEQKKKLKKKRDLSKYPALNPRLNARTRQEVLDMDYLKTLGESDLDFLNKFMGEYVSGAFKKDASGEYSDSNLQKTVEERRECYSRNNARNRCGLTIANATGNVVHADDMDKFLEVLLDKSTEGMNPNWFSDMITDRYYGDIDMLEEEMLEEMYADYKASLNPITKADREIAESSYGKRLKLIFNSPDFIKKN